MGLILQIDTATEKASVSVANDGNILGAKENANQKDHAAFVQIAVRDLCKELGIELKKINAVAVISGPGSYTGLRVGLATAKGLCFALNIPLITINTLRAMAFSSILQYRSDNLSNSNQSTIFCPMIDARRLEVFTALYDEELNVVLEPTAMILDETSFIDMLKDRNVIFSGSGFPKFQKMFEHQKLNSNDSLISTDAFSILANKLFIHESFTEVAYAEPEYLKTFFTPAPKTS